MKRKVKETLGRIPFVGRIFLGLFRFGLASRYLYEPGKRLFVWLVRSKETTNFTYDLEFVNKKYLVSMIAHVVGKDYFDILKYIHEIEDDSDLKNHICNAIIHSKEKITTDLDVRYSRRIGWYAVARATKPKIVVETGVDKGLGSCVLVTALMRNREEGFPGYYYGTDINPAAGYLFRGKYAEHGKILIGDSIESLKKIEGPIDLFINDSDHSPGYEAKEYETVKQKLSTHAIILGDNAHVTDILHSFALQTGRKFLFFGEKPYRHWYPGGGIGFAFKMEGREEKGNNKQAL